MTVRRGLLPACGLLLLAGCAKNSLVLVPSENGAPGAVAVLNSDGAGGETVVSETNSRTSIGRGQPVTRPHKLNKQERTLLDALPPPPIRLTLYFKEGTTMLTPESRPSLDYLRAQVHDRPGAEAQVTGYTDTLGSDDDNDALSQRRAEEVVELLAAEGIDRAAMTAVGRGERSLRVQTADRVREAANRRVEVIVR
jgi:outer membrane protein OmpA-like peptidoglycan-associated protein